MTEHLLFVTGKLAERALRRVLASMDGSVPFTWEIRVLGVSVAALMTADLIRRRLDALDGVTRVVLPGRCRGDLDALAAHFGRPFERGPDELKDLPRHFGAAAAPRDLTRTDVTIFAEIVDAPDLALADIVERAEAYAADGADVIDLGCLPDTPFAHLEDAVRAVRAAGLAVSVDSLDETELRRGIGAGAQYCFSLTGDTLGLVDDHECTPVLIAGRPGDLDELSRTIERFAQTGRPFFADPVLDPLHHGFTASLRRYLELRERFPDIAMLMGTGNLSELTHADTLGLNTLLLGVVSELGITAVLTTEVSRHCRSVVREIEHARRILFAAREDGGPPRHIDEALLALHDRHPFPYSTDEIVELASDVRDSNFRIQVNDDGIHVYNRDGLRTATDPYDLFPQLGVDDDAPHAFYLGLELARAEIAWQLGKRYAQDEALSWGCVVASESDDKLEFAPERSTLTARRRSRTRGPAR